jgi:hypothetical protein
MTSQHHWRQTLAIAFAGLLLPLLLACASPGPPRPPSLHLPSLVTDLAAERAGNTVRLHWTTPSGTTDGLGIKGQLTAELCRETGVPGELARGGGKTAPTQPHTACTRLTRLPVKPGPSQATDPLPANLTAEPATLIAYRVQIFNAANRSAGTSRPAFAAAGAAPPPVAQLRGAASRNGAIIEWQTEPATDARIELDRILLPTFSQTTKPAAPTAPKNSLNLAPNLPSEVRLQTPNDSPDPGGTLDRTARKTETYTYQAQRVRTVTLEGHTLELRSAPSPIITVHLADTFPPLPPAELAAVPGENAASIDLSWQPVVDNDLAGYLIYRRAANTTAPFQKLTSKPVTAPAYTDTTTTPGQRYTYRVTAIDATGNESPPSNEAEETARN